MLNSLIASKQVFDNGVNLVKAGLHINDAMLHDYMRLKRKKMSQKMMVLTDCIALEEPLPEGLLDFIEQMSEICELRAVAFKDLQAATTPGSLSNNLYYFWLLHKKGHAALDSSDLVSSAVQRTDFFQFIEDYCREELMDRRYRLRESTFFDAGVFEETMKLIETYYKLDPQLALLTQRSSKAKL